jgi:hypothetical protein
MLFGGFCVIALYRGVPPKAQGSGWRATLRVRLFSQAARVRRSFAGRAGARRNGVGWMLEAKPAVPPRN